MTEILFKKLPKEAKFATTNSPTTKPYADNIHVETTNNTTKTLTTTFPAQTQTKPPSATRPSKFILLQTPTSRKLPDSQSHFHTFQTKTLQLLKAATLFILPQSLRTLIKCIPLPTLTTMKHDLPRATHHTTLKTWNKSGFQLPSALTDIHPHSLSCLHSHTSVTLTVPTTAYLQLQASQTSSKQCQVINLIPTADTLYLFPNQ